MIRSFSLLSKLKISSYISLSLDFFKLFFICTDFQTLTLQLDHHKTTDENILAGTISSSSASSGDLLLQQSPKNKTKLARWGWIDVKIAFKVFLVIASGCLSSVPFEMIMRRDRGSGMFAAFFLHIYTVSIGFPRASRENYLLGSKMPITWHIMLVCLSFMFIVFKTAAIENMPMPLFIVGSNMQLVAGVVIGYVVDGHSYSLGQICSVLFVTLGCIIVTLNGDGFTSSLGLASTLFGLFCITTAVSILSFLVSASNIAVKRYGADTLEQMFRQHLFSLPLFFVSWETIGPRFRTWSESPSIFTIFGSPVPILYVLLLCTTVFAQINRYLSTNLAIETGALESQIVCAATKTIVLLVSLLYFNAPPYPSIRIWAGVILQLLGSLMYARITAMLQEKGNLENFMGKTKALKRNDSDKEGSNSEEEGSFNLGMPSRSNSMPNNIEKGNMRRTNSKSSLESLMQNVVSPVKEKEALA